MVVCGGIYGVGVYFGYVGNFLKNKVGVSYNVNGVSGCNYFIFFIFNFVIKKCVLW